MNWEIAASIFGFLFLVAVAFAVYFRLDYNWAREGWDRCVRCNESEKFQREELQRQFKGLSESRNAVLVSLQLAKDEKARVTALYDSQTNRMHTTIQQREELNRLCNTQEEELDWLRRHVDLTDASVARLQILLKQKLSKDKPALLRELRKQKAYK